MKYLNIVLDFIKRNATFLMVVGVIIIVYILSTIINNSSHRVEIKSLEKQITQKEEQLQKEITEKNRLKDSANYFEEAAAKANSKIAEIKGEVNSLEKEKTNILNKLNNLSKETIDSFIHERYINVKKDGVIVSVDKKVGNEIVKELTEKDYMTTQISLMKTQNILLTNQADTLRKSLSYSKQALAKAEYALKISTENLQLTEEANKLLQKDLKKSKHKAFWNNIKGLAIGVAIGVAAGIVAQ